MDGNWKEIQDFYSNRECPVLAKFFLLHPIVGKPKILKMGAFVKRIKKKEKKMLCTFHNKCLTAHYIRPKFLLTLKNKTDEKGAIPTDIYTRYARNLF